MHHFLSSKYMCSIIRPHFLLQCGIPSVYQVHYHSWKVKFQSELPASPRSYIWEHTSTRRRKISEILFYQLLHFVGEFQNLFIRGKGSGSILAIPAWGPRKQLCFHIRARHSGRDRQILGCLLASQSSRTEVSRFREHSGADTWSHPLASTCVSTRWRHACVCTQRHIGIHN